MDAQRMEPPRKDILVGWLRYETNRPDTITLPDLLGVAADTIEATIASPHVDAKHWAEVGRLRARVTELEAAIDRAAGAPAVETIDEHGIRHDSVYSVLNTIRRPF